MLGYSLQGLNVIESESWLDPSAAPPASSVLKENLKNPSCITCYCFLNYTEHGGAHL